MTDADKAFAALLCYGLIMQCPEHHCVFGLCMCGSWSHHYVQAIRTKMHVVFSLWSTHMACLGTSVIMTLMIRCELVLRPRHGRRSLIDVVFGRTQHVSAFGSVWFCD